MNLHATAPARCTGQCECTGQCGHPHNPTGGRCLTTGQQRQRLALLPEQDVPASAACLLGSAQLVALCPGCASRLTAARRKARELTNRQRLHEAQTVLFDA